MKVIEEKIKKVTGEEEVDVARIVYINDDGTICFTAEANKRIINNNAAFAGLAVLVTPPHADEFRTPDAWVSEAQAIKDGVVVRNAAARRTLSAANAEEGVDPYTGCQNAAIAALVRNMGIYPPVFTSDEKKKLVAFLSGEVVDTSTDTPTETTVTETEAPTKRRGRPAGSKNKEKEVEQNTEEVKADSVEAETTPEIPEKTETAAAPTTEEVAKPVEETPVNEVTEEDYELVLNAPARFKGMTVKQAVEKAATDNGARTTLLTMLKSADFTKRFPKEAKAIKSLLG